MGCTTSKHSASEEASPTQKVPTPSDHGSPPQKQDSPASTIDAELHPVRTSLLPSVAVSDVGPKHAAPSSTSSDSRVYYLQPGVDQRNSQGSQQSLLIGSAQLGAQHAPSSSSLSSMPTTASQRQSLQTPGMNKSLSYDTLNKDPDTARDLASSFSLDSTGPSRLSQQVAASPAGADLQCIPPNASAGDLYRAAKRVSTDLGIARPGPSNPPQTPLHLASEYLSLGVFQPGDPLPLSTIQMLWGHISPNTCLAAALQLQEAGVLRVADLPNGSTWCLLTEEHAAHIMQRAGHQLAAEHDRLVAQYTQQGKLAPADIQDDGYMPGHLVHHLLGAGRVAAARQLLLDPYWLEEMLATCGSAALVTDFCRYLQQQDDPTVKLVLHALQLSVAACLDRPLPSLVSHQIISRLLAATQGTALQGWHEEYRHMATERIQEALQPGGAQHGGPVHLLPRTASLGQAGGLLHRSLKGHSREVTQALLSPNGTVVVTASLDGTVQVWDMEVGDGMLQLVADRQPVTALAMSGDGRLCASGSERGGVFIWDLASGRLLLALAGHKGRVTSLTLDPNNRYVVSAATDRSVRLWQLATGRCLHTLQAVAQAGVPGAGDVGTVLDIATSGDGLIVAAASNDFTTSVWRAVDGRLLHVLKGHTGWVVGVAFVPGSSIVVTASHDGSVRLWDALSGKCVEVFEGHEGRVNRVVVSGDGSRILSASDDCTARVWDVRQRTNVSVLSGHQAWVSDIAITHDGRRAVTASGDACLMMWDADRGACIEVMQGHHSELSSVHLSPDGRYAVSASTDTTACVWDLQAASRQPLLAHQGCVRGVQVLHGQETAASVGEDGVLKLWDVPTCCFLTAASRHQIGIRWLCAAADGDTCVTASADRRICRWSLGAESSPKGSTASSNTDIISCTMSVPEQQGCRVKAVAVDAACSVAVVLLMDSTCSVWELVPHGETAREPVPVIRKIDRNDDSTHSGGVTGVYMSAGGARVLTVSKDFTARVWHAGTGAILGVLGGHKDTVVTGAFSRDDTLMATASADGEVRVWSAQDLRCLLALRHAQGVVSIAFDPCGRRIVALTDQHVGVLWDLGTGKRIALMEGHKRPITGLAFTSDGAFVATYAEDGTLLVWSCLSGRLAALYLADTAITSASFSGLPSASSLVLGDVRGMLHFIDFPSASA